MLGPPPRSYASGIFPYAMVAAMAWPELGRFVPPDALLVFIFIFALMPWAGLAPGLTPILVLCRLRGWVPHPWAGNERATAHTVVLVLVSPILIPAVFAAAVLLFWPIRMDYKRYRESTGETDGGAVASAAAAHRGGEKHDWRKWLNTRWIQSFGFMDVTDPNLAILSDAVRANPVSYLSQPQEQDEQGQQEQKQKQEKEKEKEKEKDEDTDEQEPTEAAAEEQEQEEALALPKRAGERPLMLRGQPHRQTNQFPPSHNPERSPEWAMHSDALMKSVFGGTADDDTPPGGKMRSATAAAAAAPMPWMVHPPMKTGCGVMRGVDSLFEGTGAKALRFTASSFCKCCDDVVSRKGEWAHVHRLDRSWHVLLSPADTVTVLKSGYGDLWPMAALGWVPVGYVLIYAPRNPEEIHILKRILRASWLYCAHGWERGEGEQLAASSVAAEEDGDE